MRCPECKGGDLRVYDTRLLIGGEIRVRRHECRDCDTRSTSYALPADLYTLLRGIPQALAKANSVEQMRAVQLQARMVVDFFGGRHTLPVMRGTRRKKDGKGIL